MANEQYIPAIKSGLYKQDRDQLIETAEKMLEIILTNARTKKLLTDSLQVSVTIGEIGKKEKKVVQKTLEPKAEKPKAEAKTETVKEEKPKKKSVKKMTDIELAQALGKELAKVPDEEDEITAEPDAMPDDETEQMMN